MEEEIIKEESNSKRIFCCIHKLLPAEIYCMKCRDFFCRNCEEFHLAHYEQLKELSSLNENTSSQKYYQSWIQNFDDEINEMKCSIAESTDSLLILNDKNQEKCFEVAFNDKKEEMTKQFDKVNSKMQTALQQTIQTIQNSKEAFNNCVKLNEENKFQNEEQVANLHQRQKIFQEMKFFEELEKNLKKAPDTADNDIKFQILLFNQLLNNEQDFDEIRENLKNEDKQNKKVLRDQNLIIIDN